MIIEVIENFWGWDLTKYNINNKSTLVLKLGYRVTFKV